MPLTLLQITDTHLFPAPRQTLLGVCTWDSLAAVLDQALAERAPDALIASGDIAQVGEAETYERFLTAVRRRYGGPCLCVAGNHDAGEALAGILPTAPLRLGGWDVLGIDTHIEGEVGGAVSDAELERLAVALARPGADHALVVGHHCPLEVQAPWLDAHRIANSDALLALLNGSGRARAYVGGHIHQELDAGAGAVRVLATPSTCFQFAPRSERFAVDDALPGYRWLTLDENGGIDSCVGRVPVAMPNHRQPATA